MSALLVRTDATTVKYVPLWSSVGSYPAKIAVRTASNTIQYAGVSKTHARDSCLRMRLADGSVGYVRRAPNDTITCGFSGSNFIDRSGHTWTKNGSPSITTISGVKCLKCFDGAYIKLEDTITLPKASKFFYRYQFYTTSTPNTYSSLFRFGNSQHYWIYWRNGGLGRQFKTNGNSLKLIDCTLNAWHWLVCTYTDGTWNAYLDGKLFDTATGGNGVHVQNFMFGINKDYSNSYYANFQAFIGSLPGTNGGYINTGADTDARTYIDMRF